ncbi:MAG: TonB-dependent receptor plug domain-containing protein [Candidatus Azobacteroides sp.]|nr:TonB-dependent receptor plug domain-containing protein [Candidatus Azobacteroides sp.]
MKKITIVLLTLIGYVTALYGQDETVTDSVIANITKQLSVFPHEKIYLHTDKPYYITGEKIFFRAFLVDAFSNEAAVLSRYIYVELINPADSVVQRLKIRPDENHLFYGAIPLSEELSQGAYKIRAYTRYMCNQGERSFFSEQVRISDPQILAIQTESDFLFDEAGKINISLRFIDSKTKEVIRPQSVMLRLNQDRPFTSKPDNEGRIGVKLTVPDKAPTRALYVEMTEGNRVMRQYLQIPYSEGDFDVSFYPEGGYLIAGEASNVAFKAVNTAGEALNITGEVIDSKGNIVTEFKTIYDGMGDFFINPWPDEHYQAICHYGNRTLRVNLPEAQKNTFALKTAIRDNKVWISVNKQDSVSYPELYLLIHSRGLIIHAKAWEPTKEFIVFDASVFPSGINHILLLTKDFRIISERLIFILNDDNGIAEFHTSKDTYQKREQIRAEVRLKDGKRQPLKGNFSIAVTNDREVITDTTTSILSEILLRSELRGSIENPEYYFRKGNKEAETAADLLMKTHGWTRYALSEVVRGDISYPEIPFETSQKFSGIVKSGLFSKPAKNFKVSLLSLGVGYYDSTETDENGYYTFGNFEFPDSTRYVIQALNSKEKGKRMTELYVDEDTFPGISPVYVSFPEEKSDSVFLDYVAKADRQYTYENGMRIIHLPEVQVKGIYKNKSKYKYESPYYLEPDYSFSEEDIEKSGGTDIRSLLYRVPGVVVAGNSISIRGALRDPLVVIDDIPYMPAAGESAMDILNNLSIYDIGQIDVLKNISNLAMFGSRGGNGVIVIYTKKRGNNIPLPSFNIKSMIPLGYQLPVEFYSPQYDSPKNVENSKPDLRTTLYWKPNVLTDEEGNAKLDFYTSDDPATYSVIIEGVSDDGKLIHYKGNSLLTVR